MTTSALIDVESSIDVESCLRMGCWSKPAYRRSLGSQHLVMFLFSSSTSNFPAKEGTNSTENIIYLIQNFVR